MEPIIPADGKTIIRVFAGRCLVARYVQTASYDFEVETAANWQALQDDARRAVEAQTGAITGSGDFECPPDLAARAVWAE